MHTLLCQALAALLLLCLVIVSTGTALADTKGSSQAVLEEMVTDYGAYGHEADAHVAALLDRLSDADPGLAAKWARIMALWQSVSGDMTIYPDVLPDGLDDTDALCIVALGFQLNADGSMRTELVERLKVVLSCAQKYPNAFIVCTGGPTASQNDSATEAGKMAQWLKKQGVASERIIVEKRSLTTAQNAIYTFDLLLKDYPQVTQLAIVSSDYHIATGTLLFGAEAILRAEEAGREIAVVSNAAYNAPSGSLSAMFQAGALIELSGDKKTAYEIYYDTYTIHPLPPLD